MRTLLSGWGSIDCWRRSAAGPFGLAIPRVLLALAIGCPAGIGAETSLRIVSSSPTEAAAVDVAEALQEDDTVVVATDAVATDVVEQVSFTEFEEPAAVQAAESSAAPAAPAESLPADPATQEMEQIEAADDVAELRVYRPITQVTIDASLPAGLWPGQTRDEEVIARDATPQFGDMRLMGGWAQQDFRWSATRLCHGPLYFEEVNLERYGYQCRPCLQPFVSGAHFFLTVPALPYKMTVHPPNECIYTLGHYRPGSRVPWRRNLPPWDARAAAVQAGVVVGLVFLIP